MLDITRGLSRETERDEERFGAFVDGLTAAFVESPEGAGTPSAGRWTPLFLDYYMTYIGGPLSKASAADVREVVFVLFPRKVSTEPESAPEIVMELRAFWEYLGRTYSLPQAGAIVALLSDDAILNLKDRLADPRNFGMGKSFFMQGKAAGFDMTNQEEMNRFMALYNASLLANGSGEPSRASADFSPMPFTPIFSTPGREARQGRREKRKAQRQARKRNRR